MVCVDISKWDEDEQVREVYARFGLAMYFAQVIEHGLVNALWVTQLPGLLRDGAPPAVHDEFFDQRFELHFGQLIRALRDEAKAPPSLLQQLYQARNDRNLLAHSYFRTRAERFFSVSGRQAMVDELEAIRERFQAIDAQLDNIVVWLGHRYGLTRERWLAAYDELRQRAEDCADP